MSKSVLLIGGTGFLGSALRRAFAQDPDYAVSYSGTSADARHLVADLLDPATLGAVRDFDIIVNLTGQVTEPMDRCIALNTTGVRNLIHALRGSGQLVVQLSTTQVYGTTQQADETSPLRPESPYAVAKAAAEVLLWNCLPHKEALIIRLCNLYGPGQAKGLPWYLLDRMRNHEEIAIADNNGELKRHFLHVEDAAQLIYGLIVHQATGTINVAGPEQYSIRELVSLCEKVLGRSLPASYGTHPPKGNIDALGTAKLRAILPPQCTHTLERYFREQLL